MTVGEEGLYSDAELAAIDGWTPPPPPGPQGVAGLRRTTAGGALAAAALLGLRDALEPPASDEAAVVIEVDGDAEEPSVSAPASASVGVAVRFDAGSPAGTVAVLRHRGGGRGGEAAGGPRR